MDIPLLRSFVAIVDHGGFTRAAERLNLTQSAMSVHLRRLEEQAGRRLMDRSSRRVDLTPDGEILLGYARRILALHDEAGSRLGGEPLEGVLRFGAPEYFASDRLPALLSRFHRCHPRVRLEVSLGLSIDLRERVAAGLLDLAIASREGDGGGRFLGREPRVWAAAEGFRLDPDAPLPLALYPPGCLSRRAALEALDRQGRPWIAACTSLSVAGVRAAALAGLAVAVLPKSEAGAGLRILEEGLPPLPDHEYALYGWEPDAASPVIHLARHIEESLGER